MQDEQGHLCGLNCKKKKWKMYYKQSLEMDSISELVPQYETSRRRSRRLMSSNERYRRKNKLKNEHELS